MSDKDKDTVLSLVPEKRSYKKHELVAFKLRINPADGTDSPLYELSMPVLTGTEGLREALEFKRQMPIIWQGLAAVGEDARDRVVRRILRGTALNAYEKQLDDQTTGRWVQRAIDARDNHLAAHPGDDAGGQAAYDAVGRPDPTNDDIDESVNAVIKYMAPFKALPRQRRFMRRKMRKPADMKIREYVNLLKRMNNEELANFPPNFDTNQKLSDEDLLDIVSYAIPKSWT